MGATCGAATAQRARPASFAGGRVSLHFIVGASGAPQRGPGPGDPARQLRRRALPGGRRPPPSRFPAAARGGAATTVDYTLEFRSTGELAVVDFPGDAVPSNLPALLGEQLGGAAAQPSAARRYSPPSTSTPRGAVHSAGTGLAVVDRRRGGGLPGEGPPASDHPAPAGCAGRSLGPSDHRPARGPTCSLAPKPRAKQTHAQRRAAPGARSSPRKLAPESLRVTRSIESTLPRGQRGRGGRERPFVEVRLFHRLGERPSRIWCHSSESTFLATRRDWAASRRWTPPLFSFCALQMTQFTHAALSRAASHDAGHDPWREKSGDARRSVLSARAVRPLANP